MGSASSPPSCLCMSCVETGSHDSFFRSVELAIHGQRCILLFLTVIEAFRDKRLDVPILNDSGYQHNLDTI